MILGFLLRLALLWAVVGAVAHFFVKAEPLRTYMIGAGVLLSLVLAAWWFGVWF
jgi:hypothetical protein